jgi:predicted protein tyrosine phosphatase
MIGRHDSINLSLLRSPGNVNNEMNILFVCSRNQWRSRTAETIFKDHQGHNVRSAGTEKDARVKVSEKLIHWADLIFVMENATSKDFTTGLEIFSSTRGSSY